MKIVLIKILAPLSKLILKKYKPFIVAITGSVGKTSTKETLHLILQAHINLRSSYSNYNNEIGLPLTIIGRKSAGSNPFAWFTIFIYAIKLILVKDEDYPKLLILETGIDKPGDMDYLTSIFKPDVAILTNISHSHYQAFDSLEGIRKEKIKLLKALKKDGCAIVNTDNEFIKKSLTEIDAKIISYGLSEADLMAMDLHFDFKFDNFKNNQFYGLRFKLKYDGSSVPVSIKNSLNFASVYAVLASLAVVKAMDYNLVEILPSLQDFKNPKARMNPLHAYNDSVLIDDSYNSSPESTFNAFKFLYFHKEENKSPIILILGDMLELGAYSDKAHKMIGESVLKLNPKLLVTVGPQSQLTKKAAISGGFNEKKTLHSDAIDSELINKIKELINKDDLIFVKASQGVRIEKLVKELLVDPNKASELLVRQSKEWLP